VQLANVAAHRKVCGVYFAGMLFLFARHLLKGEILTMIFAISGTFVPVWLDEGEVA
jgi:hypothetical protein